MNKTHTTQIFAIALLLYFAKSWAQRTEPSVDVRLAPPGINAGPGSQTVGKMDNAEPVIKLDSLGYAPMTLESAIDLAIRHNRILKYYRLSDEISALSLKQAEFRFLPSAYITGGRNESRNDDLGYTIKKKGLSSSLGFSRALETGGYVSIGVSSSSSESSNNSGVTNYNTSVGISVSQPLLQGFGIKVNMIPIDRAKAYANVSLLYVKQNLIDLVTAIESQYWDLILVYEDYKIQQQAFKRAKDLLEVNKMLIESGRMAAQEIVQAESDLASREISVAGAENSITLNQVALQSQLDLEKRLLIRPTTQMNFKPVALKLEDCLERAFANRPDWAIWQLYLDISRMDLLVAKNSNRYYLGSYASVGSDANRTDDFYKTTRDAFGFNILTWNIGLSFSFPFNKQYLANGYEIARIANDRQEVYVEELRDNIRIDVENAVRLVQYTLNQVGLAQRAKELAAQKLQLEEDKMRVGRSSNFQVISYQRDLTNAQNEELRAIAGYLKALGQLERSMGTTLQKWGMEVENSK
jgi:outer membrane protein TolC